MARIRTIKPEFFRNYKLFSAEIEEKLPIRLAFAGLWTACDRDGRFKWIPETLKLDCLPFDECDFSRVLDALWTRGYIVKYTKITDGETEFFGYIPTWNDHQHINNRESVSTIPNPDECEVVTRGARVIDTSAQLPRGREGEGKGKEREIHVNDVSNVKVIFPWDSEEFNLWWSRWKDYKKKEHRFSFKSGISEQMSLNKLAKLAGGAEITAIKIIENSIANGYQGLFELKERRTTSTIPDSYKEQILREVNAQ